MQHTGCLKFIYRKITIRIYLAQNLIKAQYDSFYVLVFSKLLLMILALQRYKGIDGFRKLLLLSFIRSKITSNHSVNKILLGIIQ